MDKNVKSVFDDVCVHLPIDLELSKRIERYRLAFVSKNADHAEFFGGNLTGVHIVRFTDSDRDLWFEEILRTDERDLESRCHAIIDPTFYQVASDVMNLSCVWLAHAFTRSTKLNEKQKLDTLTSIFQIMQYKFLTSRMFRHWKYPASKDVAEATLAAMSNKYSIKAKGSWNAVLRDRAVEISDLKRSIHKKTITYMEIDLAKSGESTAYLINDTQGRIRDMLKNIYGLFEQIHRKGIKVGTNSSIVNLDGEDSFKDKVNVNQTYKRYLSSILPDRKSFIKNELVEIILRSNPTMPERLFINTLEWISDNYQRSNRVHLEDTIETMMTHLLKYLGDHRDVMKNKNDVIGLLTHMKGIYTASRTSDEDLLKVRKNLENIVTHATGNKSPTVVAATRTGIMLYILLRTFTMKHYS